ncbi:MAG TPA: cytochrome c [Candidatus Sulfotelmatobacter sp.]|nr:cytochrome c [Candidatus Sulfotelmatobacter sp.]
MRTFLLSLSFISFALSNAAAQNSASELTTNPVFQKNCAKCHGKTGEGRHFAGPSLVSGKSLELSADQLRTIVSSGKKRMPKFEGKLSTEEIDTLVRQIEGARQK